MGTRATQQPTHDIGQIAYPGDMNDSASGMADEVLTEHVIAQVMAAQARAQAAKLALVAVSCTGPLRTHVHEDPRTAQVVARAVGRVEADIAFIMDHANECARVVMDCGMRVAMTTRQVCRA